jgi:hypothetical protein
MMKILKKGTLTTKDISIVIGAVIDIRHENYAPAKIKKLRNELDELENQEHSYVYSEQIADLKTRPNSRQRRSRGKRR